MESGKTPEQISPVSKAGEVVGNNEIDSLPEKLGFLETTELMLLKQTALETYAASETEETIELRSHYQVVGEEVVNQPQGEEYTRAQIGLMVATGLLRRDTGDVDGYINDLDDALMHATNMGYEDVVSTIENAKSQVKKTDN
jgi:hypothetical protein